MLVRQAVLSAPPPVQAGPGHFFGHLHTPCLLNKPNHTPCSLTGEDPLVDDQNERDINSVAGVLKLYFRGLENPLFPKERFQDLISTISKYFPGRMINSLTHHLLKLHYGFITVLTT